MQSRQPIRPRAVLPTLGLSLIVSLVFLACATPGPAAVARAAASPASAAVPLAADGSYFGAFEPAAPNAANSLKQDKADWYKDEIFYHVWLYAFADSDKNGIGDLAGVTSKLDYLQSLGVTAVWLSPFWKTPSTHGYDVVDYYQVEPRFGSLGDLFELLSAAHKRGMKVIFDFVPNHVSAQNPWFTDSRDRRNDKRDWFLWKNEVPAAGWKDFGGNPAWRPWGEDPETGDDQFNYALFWNQMPDLNYREPAVREAMAGVVSHWLNFGFDGMRVDAVKYLFETPATGANSDQPETYEFFRRLRQEVLEPYTALGYPKFMVAENWTGDNANLLRYQSADGRTNDGFNATLDFPFGSRLSEVLSGKEIAQQSLANEYRTLIQPITRAGGWTFTFLSNHDNYQSRPATQYGAEARVRLAQAIQMCAWGTPVLYYGNEVGMAGVNGDDRNMRQPFPWAKLPALQADVDSVWNWQALLNRLRRDHRALRHGDFTVLPSPANTLAFVRSLDNEALLVVLNLSGKAQADFTLELGAWQKTTDYSVLVGDTGDSLAGSKLGVHGLKGTGVRIYRLNAAGQDKLRGDFAG